MTASEQNNRRAEKAEVSRQNSTTEALAFMTALVASLEGAHAARHHNASDVRPVSTDSVSPQAHHADPTLAAAPTGDHQLLPGDQHAAVSEVSPNQDAPTPPPMTSATAESGSEAGGAVHMAPLEDHGAGSDAPSVLTSPESVGASDGTAHGGSAGLPTDPTVSPHEFGNTITGLIDTSVATVSHALDGLNTTVTELTSSVTRTLGHLTDSVNGIVGGLLQSTGIGHEAPTNGLIGSLASDIVTSPLGSLHDGAANHGPDMSGLGTAGTLPTMTLPSLPLHLGFLGQPTGDGHDIHDGAFSALGVHHF